MAMRDFADIYSQTLRATGPRGKGVYISKITTQSWYKWYSTHSPDRWKNYRPLTLLHLCCSIWWLIVDSIVWANSWHSYIIMHAKSFDFGIWFLKMLLQVLKLAHTNIKLHYWVSKQVNKLSKVSRTISYSPSCPICYYFKGWYAPAHDE